MPTPKTFNLEDRLINFACLCLDVCDQLPHTKAGQNLEYQLSKSCTAAALIYGEAQAAESPADFLHKIKLVLKEIRETRVNLRIIFQKPLSRHPKIDLALDQSGQLMAIFLKSVEQPGITNLLIRKEKSWGYRLPDFLFCISYFL